MVCDSRLIKLQNQIIADYQVYGEPKRFAWGGGLDQVKVEWQNNFVLKYFVDGSSDSIIKALADCGYGGNVLAPVVADAMNIARAGGTQAITMTSFTLTQSETDALISTLENQGWEQIVLDLRSGKAILEILNGLAQSDLIALKNTLPTWLGLIEQIDLILTNSGEIIPVDTIIGIQPVETIISKAGHISSLNHSIVSGDELDVTVQVQNPTNTTQEYKVVLYTLSGIKINTEPDFSWKNVGAGQFFTFNLTTRGRATDIKDLIGGYRIELYTQGWVIQEGRTINLTTGQVEEGSFDPTTVLYPPTNTGVVSPLQPIIIEDSGDGSFLTGLGTAGVIALVVGAAIILKKR